MFVALGLTIFGPSELWDDLPEGIVLFLFLALVARPIAVALLLWRVRLRSAEKLFIAWGGLKGAVPILLAAFALVGDVPDAPAIYNIVFVVVALSVLVQGSTIPWVAHRLGVPMRVVEPEPWDVSIRLREPGQIQRYTVGPRSRVLGSAIRDLPLGERAWVSFVVQDGKRGRRAARTCSASATRCTCSATLTTSVLQRLFEGPSRVTDRPAPWCRRRDGDDGYALADEGARDRPTDAARGARPSRRGSAPARTRGPRASRRSPRARPLGLRRVRSCGVLVRASRARRSKTAGADGLALWALFEAVHRSRRGSRRERPVAERVALAADHVLYGLVLTSGR